MSKVLICLWEKLSMVSSYRRGSPELQQRHVMCVSELMRLSAAVCAGVTERNTGMRTMEHLAGLLGQLLAAGCSAGSRNTLTPVLLQQARQLPASVIHRPWTPTSPAHASCSVQMLTDEHSRWPLCAKPLLLAAVRQSGWDAVSMQKEAVTFCENRQRDLGIEFANPDTLEFSKEDLLDYASQLNSCQQWVLLLHARLPQACKLLATAKARVDWPAAAYCCLFILHRPVPILAQVLLQKLRRTAVHIIQLTVDYLHIVPSLSGVTTAAVHLLLALPCDDEALRSVLPGLSKGQRHPQVRTDQRGCTYSGLKALIAGHWVVAIPCGAEPCAARCCCWSLSGANRGSTCAVRQMASAAAAVVARCGIVRPPPVAFVRGSLLHQHWAVRHAAMEGLVAYTRAAVDDSDLRSVVPVELQAPGTQHEAFCLLLEQSDRRSMQHELTARLVVI